MDTTTRCWSQSSYGVDTSLKVNFYTRESRDSPVTIFPCGSTPSFLPCTNRLGRRDPVLLLYPAKGEEKDERTWNRDSSFLSEPNVSCKGIFSHSGAPFWFLPFLRRRRFQINMVSHSRATREGATDLP